MNEFVDNFISSLFYGLLLCCLSRYLDYLACDNELHPFVLQVMRPRTIVQLCV